MQLIDLQVVLLQLLPLVLQLLPIVLLLLQLQKALAVAPYCRMWQNLRQAALPPHLLPLRTLAMTQSCLKRQIQDNTPT